MSIVRDAMLSVLPHLPGAEAALQKVRDDEDRQSRRAIAYDKYERAVQDEASLPALAAAVADAERALAEATRGLQAKAHAARRAYRRAADGAGIQRVQAEGRLRATAPRIVHEDGRIVRAVWGAIEHARQHTLASGDRERWHRVVKFGPHASHEPKDLRLHDVAKRDLALDASAREHVHMLEDLLSALRDLQLVARPGPDDVRELIEEVLVDQGEPLRCPCGASHGVVEAMDAALQPLGALA
jgi:hypothetical protein